MYQLLLSVFALFYSRSASYALVTPRVTLAVDRGWTTTPVCAPVVAWPGLPMLQPRRGCEWPKERIPLRYEQGCIWSRMSQCPNDRLDYSREHFSVLHSTDGSVPQRGTRIGIPVQARNERSAGLLPPAPIGNEVPRGGTRAFNAQNHDGSLSLAFCSWALSYLRWRSFSSILPFAYVDASEHSVIDIRQLSVNL